MQAVNSNGYALAFWGNQTGFAYDPLQMKDIKLPQSLDDVKVFIDKNPYKFGYNNPQFGASGQAFIERILSVEGGEFNHLQDKVDPQVLKGWQKGWKWFQNNRDKMVLTGSQADSLTRMNDGEISLAPAWQDHLNTLQKTGAVTKRLKFYIPEFGMPSGGNFVGISKNAMHPAASAVFVNWLVSAKIQAELKEFAGSVPVNKKLTKGLDSDKKISFYSHAYSVELKKEFLVNR